MIDWANDYVGVPYAGNGRDRRGCDCWGLMVMVFREQRGIDLPDWLLPDDYTLSEAVRAITLGIGETKHQAERLDAAEAWAVVVAERRTRPHHVGLCIGRGHVLHCSRAGVICPPAVLFNREYPERSYWRWLD